MRQVIFPTIVYRQIMSLIIYCITIPVGQKFTYAKFTVSLNSLAAQQGRSHCPKSIKKPDYGLQPHIGTKIILFGEMSSGLMKQ